MKLPCSVIHDLLPLYAENMVEPDTKDLVDQHLTECPDCQKRFSETRGKRTGPLPHHLRRASGRYRCKLNQGMRET